MIFISVGFIEDNPSDEINAIYLTEPIGHAYGYYLFEGNKVGRYIRNVGTFYREGNYSIDKHDSLIKITYTIAAFSKYPFKKAGNNYDDQKFETLKYRAIEKDGRYIIDGLDTVQEKDRYRVTSDIKSIRKGSKIRKSIK